MVAYGFKEMFIEPTWSGRKPHTIRNKRTGRSRHARPGEQIQHYVNMRTKKCRLFARSVCSDVRDIRLTFARPPDNGFFNDSVKIEGVPLIRGAEELDVFARSDGFKDWAELRAFWKINHDTGTVFDGDIIYWKDMEPVR